jgi:hypothetical protein
MLLKKFNFFEFTDPELEPGENILKIWSRSRSNDENTRKTCTIYN